MNLFSLPLMCKTLLVFTKTMQCWWDEVHGSSILNYEQVLYFKEVFDETSDGEHLFRQFGKDEIAKIPSVLSQLDRNIALNATRKMFDKFLMFNIHRNKMKLH